MTAAARNVELNECRRCATYCDRVIEPAACLARACPSLLLSAGEAGRRVLGCLHRVFASDIDAELFEQAERTPAGFGAVKVTGAPMPWCPFSIEQAHPGAGDAHRCCNPRFLDWPPSGSGAIRIARMKD